MTTSAAPSHPPLEPVWISEQPGAESWVHGASKRESQSTAREATEKPGLLLGRFPSLKPKQSPFASDDPDGGRSETGTFPQLLFRGEHKSNLVMAYLGPSADRPSFISRRPLLAVETNSS